MDKSNIKENIERGKMIHIPRNKTNQFKPEQEKTNIKKKNIFFQKPATNLSRKKLKWQLLNQYQEKMF